MIARTTDEQTNERAHTVSCIRAGAGSGGQTAERARPVSHTGQGGQGGSGAPTLRGLLVKPLSPLTGKDVER